MWDSGKGKTMQEVKRSVVTSGMDKGRMWSIKDFLGQKNDSVWYYNGGYMSFYICENA